jgi:hypothetical protein
MTCEWCGQKVQFTFVAFSRSGRFVDRLSEVCSECAELVNDEYYCGEFRSLVPLDVLSTEIIGDFSIRGSLVA